MIHNKCPNQNEFLALPFQMMEYGMQVDLTPKFYPNVEGKNGTQSLIIDRISYPLEFDGIKVHVRISKPTQEDYDTLPTIEMTASYPFNLEIDSLHKPRRLNNKNIRITQRRMNKISELTGMPMQEWKKQLARAPDDVIDKTMGCTTQ